MLYLISSLPLEHLLLGKSLVITVKVEYNKNLVSYELLRKTLVYITIETTHLWLRILIAPLSPIYFICALFLRATL